MTTKKTPAKKVSRKKTSTENKQSNKPGLSQTSSHQKKEAEDINRENFLDTAGTESSKSPSVQSGMMDIEGDYDQRNFDKQRIQSEYGSQRENTDMESRDSEGYHNYFEQGNINEQSHQGAHVGSRYDNDHSRNDQNYPTGHNQNEYYGAPGESPYSSHSYQERSQYSGPRSNYYESQFQHRQNPSRENREYENYHPRRYGNQYQSERSDYENQRMSSRNYSGQHDDFERRNWRDQGNYNESRGSYQRYPENYRGRNDMNDDYYRRGRNPQNEGRSYESRGHSGSYYEPPYNERGSSHGWQENTRSYNERNPRGRENQSHYENERGYTERRGGSNFGGGREQGYSPNRPGSHQNYDAPHGGYYPQGPSRGPSYGTGGNREYGRNYEEGMNENWNIGNYGNRHQSQRSHFNDEAERENRRRNDQENEVW